MLRGNKVELWLCGNFRPLCKAAEVTPESCKLLAYANHVAELLIVASS